MRRSPKTFEIYSTMNKRKFSLRNNVLTPGPMMEKFETKMIYDGIKSASKHELRKDTGFDFL